MQVDKHYYTAIRPYRSDELLYGVGGVVLVERSLLFHVSTLVPKKKKKSCLKIYTVDSRRGQELTFCIV